jgi:2'-5' RNA ligase
VARSGRIRLFCALLLPDDAADRLAAWQVHLDAGRAVVRENLHVTLAFLGHQPEDELPAIVAELQAAAAAAGPVVLEPAGYRETRSVGMVALADIGGAATALADDLGERLERLGVYRREARAWLPHVTVLRFRERPRLAPPDPPAARISPSDAAVYSSVLQRQGAQYVILETVALGGR